MSCKHEWSPWIRILSDIALEPWGDFTMHYAGYIRACNKCMIAQFDINTLGGIDDQEDLEKVKAKQNKKKTSKRKKK